MEKYNKILEENYSDVFDNLRKKMMVTSAYKYGSIKDNVKNDAYDWIESLKIRVAKFEETKNTEYLADAANYCMMIHMFPEKHGCHYKPTDSGDSPGIAGISIKELQDFE